MNARLARWIDLARRFEPSPRGKKLMGWVGYPLFAFVVAMTTLVLAVPQERIKDRLETALSADVGTPTEPMAIGMDVSIGDLSATLLSGLGFKADNIIMRSRPLIPTEKPARYIVDDVRVHVGLFGLVFNHPSYRFKGHALGGTASGTIDNAVEESRARIEIEKMSLASIPGLPLPIDGTLGAKLDVDLPKNLLANAAGSIELGLDEAVIGDGKAKLTVPTDPFLASGVTIPRVRLGKLSGAIVIEKGRARFENVRAHSADADATLEGYVELHDPIGLSQVHAFLKFRAAETLTKKEATIDLLVNALGGTARRPDGFLGVQITGPLVALSYLPSKEPPFGVTTRNEPPPLAAPPPPTPTPSAAPFGAANTPPPAPPPVNEPAPSPPAVIPSAAIPIGTTAPSAPSGAGASPPSAASGAIQGPPPGAPNALPPGALGAVPPSGAGTATLPSAPPIHDGTHDSPAAGHDEPAAPATGGHAPRPPSENSGETPQNP